MVFIQRSFSSWISHLNQLLTKLKRTSIWINLKMRAGVHPKIVHVTHGELYKKNSPSEPARLGREVVLGAVIQSPKKVKW